MDGCRHPRRERGGVQPVLHHRDQIGFERAHRGRLGGAAERQPEIRFDVGAFLRRRCRFDSGTEAGVQPGGRHQAGDDLRRLHVSVRTAQRRGQRHQRVHRRDAAGSSPTREFLNLRGDRPRGGEREREAGEFRGHRQAALEQQERRLLERATRRDVLDRVSAHREASGLAVDVRKGRGGDLDAAQSVGSRAGHDRTVALPTRRCQD